MLTSRNMGEAIRASSSDRYASLKAHVISMLQKLEGLSDVESLIKTKLRSEAPRLEEIGNYLLTLGGKRMRPVLTLVSGKMFGLAHPSRALIEVSAGIELIHMATLLHDDIIDKSPIRRHQESAFKRYGVDHTLLAGDFLLTRAFSLCAHLDTFIIDETEQACIDLTEGEILEIPLHVQISNSKASLEIARKKTSALFRLGALCGAHLSGAGEVAEQEMAKFGENLGIAFQILDDILDVTSDEATLGKRPGVDLRERKPSLVNVLWVQSGNKLAGRLTTPPTDNEDSFIEESLEALRGSAVIEAAEEVAVEYAEAARSALHKAANSSDRVSPNVVEDLELLVDYTLKRAS